MTKKVNRAAAAWLAVSWVILSSSIMWAGVEGRVSGVVTDPAGDPIEGVRVTISAVAIDIQRSAESNKKGKFTITLLDASRDFTIRLEKEGFQVIEEPIDPAIGGTTKPKYTMTPGKTVEPEELAELQQRGRAAKLYNEGVKNFGARDVDAALELFLGALEEDPDLGEAHLAIARIYLARDDYAAALEYAEKANELVAEDPTSALVLFDSLWGLDQTERALSLLDQMVEGGKESSKVAVRSYNAGVRAVKASDWPAARTRFEDALALDSTLVPAHVTLSQIAINEGDYQSAIDHATSFVESQPDNPKGLSVLYQAHQAAGHEEEAKAAFGRMAAADPEMVARTFLEEGINHFNAGHNPEAMAAFRKVLVAQSDHPQGHYYLGLTSASSGDISGARQHLGRFLELAPDDPEAEGARAMLAGLQ